MPPLATDGECRHRCAVVLACRNRQRGERLKTELLSEATAAGVSQPQIEVRRPTANTKGFHRLCMRDLQLGHFLLLFAAVRWHYALRPLTEPSPST